MYNKIDDYMIKEQQSQFSDEKRAQVWEQQLGKSKISEHYEESDEELKLQKEARNKMQSVFTCVWDGVRFIERDSRRLAHLCPGCEAGRSQIEWFMRMNKKSTLTDEDRVNISKTSRRGPFFKAN